MPQGTTVSGLGATLKRLFVPETPENPAARSARAAPERAQRSSIPVGRFSMIGLAGIREHLGPRWPALADKVHATARLAIERSLLPGDAFEPDGEDGYIVLFAQLGQREADFKCRAIAKEVSKRLLGSEWDQLATVETVCVPIPANAMGAPDMKAMLSEAFADGRTSLSSQADHAADPGMDEIRKRQAAEWAQLRVNDHAAGTKNEMSAAEPPPGSGPALETARAIWSYLPIWDFQQSAIFFFRLVVADELRHGSANLQPDKMFELDCRALKKAVSDVLSLADRGRRLPIVCPVHGTSLDHGGRALTNIVQHLPPSLRRMLTLELTVPPAWPAHLQLHAVIANLKALRVGVWARLPIDSASFKLMNSGLGLVTAQLPHAGPSESECMKLLDTFAAAARRAGAECGAAGITSRSLALAASAAGFRYLSGSAIHGEVEALEQATRYDLDRLYGDVMPDSPS